MSFLDFFTDPFTNADDIEDAGKENRERLLALAQTQRGLLPWQGEGTDANFYATQGKLNYELSPELQGIYDTRIDDYSAQEAQFSQYSGDPEAAAEVYYDRYKSIVDEEQEQERLALENRLLSQGMLGSTGGGMRTKALHGAQMKADMMARMSADTQVQNIIDLYRKRGDTSLQSAFTVADRPFKYSNEALEQGQLAGDQLAAANTLAAQGYQSDLQAQMASAASTTDFTTSMLGLAANRIGYDSTNGFNWGQPSAPSANEAAQTAWYKSKTK